MDSSSDERGHQEPSIDHLGTAPDDVVLLFFHFLYINSRFEDLHHFASTSKRLWLLCRDMREAALRLKAINAMGETGQQYLVLCAAQWHAVRALPRDFQLRLLQALIGKVAGASAFALLDMVPMAIGWVEAFYSIDPQAPAEVKEERQEARRQLLLPLLESVRSRVVEKADRRALEVRLLRAGGRKWGQRASSAELPAVVQQLEAALAAAKRSEEKKRFLARAYGCVVSLLPLVEVEKADDAWWTLSQHFDEVPLRFRVSCLYLLAIHIPDLSASKQAPAFEWVDAGIKKLHPNEQAPPTIWLLKSAACLPLKTRTDLLKTQMALLKQRPDSAQVEVCAAVLQTLPPSDSEPGFDQLFDLTMADGIDRLHCLQLLSGWLEFTSPARRVEHFEKLARHLQKLRPVGTASIDLAITKLVARAPCFEPAQLPLVIPHYLSLVEGMHPAGTSEHVEALLASLCIAANKAAMKGFFESIMALIGGLACSTSAQRYEVGWCAASVASQLRHLPPADAGTIAQQLTDKLGGWCADELFDGDCARAHLSLAVELLRTYFQHPQLGAPLIVAGHMATLWRTYVVACGEDAYCFDEVFVTTIAETAYLLPEKEQRERFDALFEHVSNWQRADLLPEIFAGCHRFTELNRVHACELLLAVLEQAWRPMPLRRQLAAIVDKLLDWLPKSEAADALRIKRRLVKLESKDDAAETDPDGSRGVVDAAKRLQEDLARKQPHQ